MPVIKGQEWTFDTVAEIYARTRPTYPRELYQAIFAYCPITADSRVAEVGIGGGQATRPLLETGCRLVAAEYGENFSRLCREKFRDFPGFSVRTGRFEELEFEPASFDLVCSASAFHWVPEELGYPKVFSMLKPGGAFARFATHPYGDKGRPALDEEIQKLYGIYMHSPVRPPEYTEEMAQSRGEIARKYGFTDLQYALFRRTRSFSAREYTALLSTYSDHITLEEGVRREFFSAIEGAIDRHGGQITVYDTLDLELARKPEGGTA